MGKVTRLVWDTFYKLSKWTLIILILLVGYTLFQNERYRLSNELKMDDVEVEVGSSEEIFDISVESKKVISGVTNYEVVIDGRTYNWTQDQLTTYTGKDSTAVKTKKYFITMKVKDSSLLTMFSDKTVEVAHYSFLGESKFTDAQIKEYKKDMLSKLTYTRYDALKIKGADQYEVDSERMILY